MELEKKLETNYNHKNYIFNNSITMLNNSTDRRTKIFEHKIKLPINKIGSMNF